VRRPNFLAWPDPDAEPIYGVEMPGKRERRRRDRRAKAPRPDRPLVMYFTRAQLTALRANVASVILRSRAGRRS
jgi:hypothetical protein